MIVKYAYDGSTSVETKRLDFVKLKGEIEEILAKILVVVQIYNLENKVVAFSANDQNTKFEGLNKLGSSMSKCHNGIHTIYFNLRC